MVNKMSFAQFREISLKRRTIRDFKKSEVNPLDILECIELGIWAPTGGGTAPGHCIHSTCQSELILYLALLVSQI